MKPLKISVIIPLKELSYYLMYEGLPELDKQTYRNFEVIVLTNEQSLYDFTLCKKYRWLRIIPTGKVTRPAKKRDIGVQNATGDLVAFIDDDAYPSADWLKNAAAIYLSEKKKTPSLAAVCGPGVVSPNASFWEKVNNEVLISSLGSAIYRYRFTPKVERYVDDYPSMNFIIEKSTFLTVGGFNSEFWPGEDSKLCNDLVHKLGKKILYHPKIIVYHHRRGDFRGFLHQHARYGYHRGAFAANFDKNSLNLLYFIPSLFVLYLVTLAPFLLVVPSRLQNLILFPLFMYMGLLLIQFLVVIKKYLNPFLAAVSTLMLGATHLVYGIIFIKGLGSGLLKHPYEKG